MPCTYRHLRRSSGTAPAIAALQHASRKLSRAQSVSGRARRPAMRAPAATSWVGCAVPAIWAPVPDLDVADGARLAAHDDEIAELGRARNADLPDDHAMPADDDVVPDLHQIINFRAFADDRILKGPAVDGLVGADFHVVLDDDPADLRHLEVAPAAHGEAETVLADPHARMDDDPVADQGVGDCCQRADVAVAADGDAVADHGAGGDACAASDAAPRGR